MGEAVQYRSEAEEIEALRAEVRELEMLGEQISYGLAQEQRASAELRTENESLREQTGGAGGEGWPYHISQTMLLWLIELCFNAAWGSGWGLENEESFTSHVFGMTGDTLAQIGMLFWCIGVVRIRGFGGLAWRLAVQAAGWGAVVGVLAWLHPDAPCTKEYFLSLAMPSNWWGQINPLMPNMSDAVIATAILAFTFDALMEFTLTRKLFNVARTLCEEALNGK